MSLQDTFYILAIIAMVMWIVFLGLLVYLLYRLQKGVTEVKESIQARTASILSLKNFTSGPVLKSVVVMASGFIFRKLGQLFKNKKKEKENA